MADVASLVVKVSTEGAEAAQIELDKLGKTAGNAEKSVGGLASSMKTLGAIASVGAMATLAKEAIKIADSMNLLDGRLKLATSSLEEFTSQQKELFNISKASFSELKGITDLYIKLDPALKRLGASTQAVNAVTSSFAKGLQVGGASAQESASAILQFSQAMGSGVLRGEEFNAIAEASPKLMKYMADGMGVPITAMRQLAQDGKLTADVVSIALLKMTQDIDKDFKELPITIGKAFTNIKTDLSKLSQEFDKTSGITKTLSDLMVDLSDDLYEYSGTVFTSLNDIINIVKSSATDISMLSKEVVKLFEVFDNASKEGTGLGLFKSSLLGLKVVIDTMYVGLHNSIVLMKELARTSKNFFEDEKLSKDFLTRVNSQILTLDDLEKKYIETYKTIIKTQEGLNKPTQDQITIDLQKEIKTIESRGKALKAEDDRKKEATKQQEKAQKDAIRLSEDWAKRNIEITTNLAIAQQDELAKPFILLAAKYEEDLQKYKSIKGAKERLTAELNAELERLSKDTAEKVAENDLKALEKAQRVKYETIQKELKLQEENFRIQARQVELLDDEADKQVALATLEYQRTQASLKAQMQLGEVTPQYYNAMMEMEDKLLEKQKQNWTLAGQVINNVTSQMESSMTDFLDATSDNFADFGKMATSILQEVYREIIRISIVKPLVSSLTSGAMSLFSGGVTANAQGGAYSSPSLSQYSNQIVDKPTFFAFASGGVPNLGVMGEAGSEAILPLTRTSSGNLGVEASGVGAQIMKIQIINESGTQMEVTKTTQTTDIEGMVIQAWISGISKNRYGSRDMLGGR